MTSWALDTDDGHDLTSETYELILAEASRRRRRHDNVGRTVLIAACLALVAIAGAVIAARSGHQGSDLDTFADQRSRSTGTPALVRETDLHAWDASLSLAVTCLRGAYGLAIEVHNTGSDDLVISEASILESPKTVLAVSGSPAAPGSIVTITGRVPRSTSPVSLRLGTPVPAGVPLPNGEVTASGLVGETGVGLFTPEQGAEACP